MKLCSLPILLGLLPLIAIYGAYAINASLGHVDWCMPNIDGCTSISRGARAGEGILLFRACMMPYVVVLILFWLVSYKWLIKLGDTNRKRLFAMVLIGSLGAFALLAYATFLGTQGEGYRFVRRYGVIFFFVFTGFSQMLLVSRLYQLPDKVGKQFNLVRQYLFSVCVIEILLAFWHLYIELFVDDYTYYSANEWNFGAALILYPFGLYFAWKKTEIDWHISIKE